MTSETTKDQGGDRPAGRSSTKKAILAVTMALTLLWVVLLIRLLVQ